MMADIPARPEKGRYAFEIWQGGMVVATGLGPDLEAVRREAMHYAMIYGQDGPVVLRCEGFALALESPPA